MAQQPDQPTPPNSLRQRAEELLRMSESDVAAVRLGEIQALVHELQVHQVELQVQNEELRRQQTELDEARARYADLYDFAPVGYMTLDQRGAIQEANLTLASMLGVERADLLGARFTSFIERDDQDTFHLHKIGTRKSDDRHICELRLRRADGTPLRAQLKSVSVEEPIAGQLQLRTVVTDTTELRQAQELALRNARLASLGTLAAGITHQVNNRFNAILIATHLGQTTQDAAVIRECLARIASAADAVTEVVQDVQRFAGQESLEKTPASLSDVLQRAHDCVRDRAAARDVAVDLQLGESLPELLMSSTEMEQVFVNLLANAIDASDDGRGVRVSVAQKSNNVEVQVSDDGQGMPAAEVAQIFDPFYSKRTASVGSGLGLSVAHGIVANHEGSIEVSSEPESGTTFKVSLPLKSA